jgi:hypothetical protein
MICTRTGRAGLWEGAVSGTWQLLACLGVGSCKVDGRPGLNWQADVRCSGRVELSGELELEGS